MKRIYSIDFFKLLFAYLIALGHFGTNVIPGSTVTVQLFFIISGFFLGKNYYSKHNNDQTKDYNQWNYTKDHIKSLYPHYVFSLFMIALYFFLLHFIAFLRQPSLSNISIMFEDIYSLIPELFLVQNAGFFGGGINFPLWQLCTLIISSYFVYGLLCLNDKLACEMIFPAAILMIQAFLNTGVDIWGTVGFFHIPILRALSPLCIGVLTYRFTTTYYYQYITSKKWIYNIASIFSIVTLFIYEEYRNIHLITFIILLLAMDDANSWINKLLNRNSFKRFGTFSYSIYLNHALVIFVLNNHVFHRISSYFNVVLTDFYRNVIFLVILTIYSIITLNIVTKIKQIIFTKH